GGEIGLFTRSSILISKTDANQIFQLYTAHIIHCSQQKYCNGRLLAGKLVFKEVMPNGLLGNFDWLLSGKLYKISYMPV
ncbi:MAG: hypothetical protein KAH06_04585, partial [Desulfobacterales bacterium]|nr:hypothetical protein [Desulfobacterales bacterium]